jgi:hypothetical protein
MEQCLLSASDKRILGRGTYVTSLTIRKIFFADYVTRLVNCNTICIAKKKKEMIVLTNGSMQVYNDQLNAQVYNLFIYLFLPYMFRAFFKPIFRGRCTN